MDIFLLPFFGIFVSVCMYDGWHFSGVFFCSSCILFEPRLEDDILRYPDTHWISDQSSHPFPKILPVGLAKTSLYIVIEYTHTHTHTHRISIYESSHL